MEKVYNYKETLIVNRVNTMNKVYKKQVKYFKDIADKDRFLREKEIRLSNLTIS